MLFAAAACGAVLLGGSGAPVAERDVTITTPSGRLHVSDGGVAGPTPVVLVHSLAGSVRQWRAQLDAIRPVRRAIAIELRGHGRSSAPADGDYSLGAMARDLDAAVTKLRLRRFVLAGHSLGGGVALAYAAAHPDRVAGLLLVDPIDDPSRRAGGEASALLDRLRSPQYAAEIERYWRLILDGATEASRRAVLDDLRNTPKETVLGAMSAMAAFDAGAAIDRYPGPIRSVVTRFNDVPTGLHRISSRVVAIPIDGTSHWIQMDKPEAFNQVLIQFVAECDARPHHD